MASLMEITQLCRLCLVKDQVNIPIFEEPGDIRQIFLKISACLPVKVAREDNLPKKICDGCSYKLEMFYEFWNTSASSEKQLLKWLEQVGIDKLPTSSDKSAQPQSHSINTDGVVLKQEVLDLGETHGDDDELPTDDLNVPTDPEYLLQQQSYQSFEFQTDGFNEGETASAAGPSSTITSGAAASAAPKRKRRAAAMKPLPPQNDSEDEDDTGLIEPKIAKTEEQSDDSAGEDHEPTTFVGLPDDNEQPGPSGVGKAATSSDAPSSRLENIKVESCINYNRLLESTGCKRRTRSRSCEEIDDSIEDIRTRQKRIWICKKCPESFNTSRKLREHRKVHRKEDNDTQYNYRYDEDKNIFICYTCDVELDTKEEIEKHVLEHEEKFVCNTCNEIFVKPYEYSCHLYSHDPSKGFTCPFCKYVTSRRTAIMIHINTYHLRKFIYTCEQCGKGFNDCVLYKEHNNIHEGLRPFQCVVCNKDFPFSSYLTTHQIRNHRVTIDGMIGANQCPVCFKYFSRSNTLENHMKRHENVGQKKVHEKKHLCDICGKGFARTEKLRIHYRVHTGVKPYSCSYCGKSFTKKDYLIMHERVHSGEKPYSCEYCGKCFNQGAPLRLHIRSHTGERPYICHLCNNGFISRGVLNLHFRNCPGSSAE